MDRREWLLLSDEREKWLKLCHWWFREGWGARGREIGEAYERGRADAMAEWFAVRDGALADVFPDGPQAKARYGEHEKAVERFAQALAWDVWHDYFRRNPAD